MNIPTIALIIFLFSLMDILWFKIWCVSLIFIFGVTISLNVIKKNNNFYLHKTEFYKCKKEKEDIKNQKIAMMSYVLYNQCKMKNDNKYKNK